MKKGVFALAVVGIGVLASIFGCAVTSATTDPSGAKVGTNPGRIFQSGPVKLKPAEGNQLAAFSGGCFWGTEDVFRQIPGVVATAVGYSGGHTSNPTYEDVCSHTTGHAETVLVEYNPAKVSYKKLLAVFWENHDPTTVNRQGPDVGSNYRSAIWTFSETQAEVARQSLNAEQKKLTHEIVTEIKPAEPFWVAEDYHQQYDEKHGTHFCPINHGS